MTVVLVDTGPLVSLFDRRDGQFTWCSNTLARLEPPFMTCEAVITEATQLLRPETPRCKAMLEAIGRGFATVEFALLKELERVRTLIDRYSSTPMALADACLVRMTEIHNDVVVWTLDTDFRIYRRHGRQKIPTIMPND